VTTGGLVKRLLDEGRRTSAEIELYLASSAHHRAAEPLLTSLGFETRSQWRMLMFKPIEEAT
jgi:phosphoglycolate phosphatase-like HAD superfamily hydrolase